MYSLLAKNSPATIAIFSINIVAMAWTKRTLMTTVLARAQVMVITTGKCLGRTNNSIPVAITTSCNHTCKMLTKQNAHKIHPALTLPNNRANHHTVYIRPCMMKTISILFLALLACVLAHQTTLRGNKHYSPRALGADGEEEIVLQEFQDVEVVPETTNKNVLAPKLSDPPPKSPSPCCCECVAAPPCKCSCTKPMGTRGGYIKIGRIKGEAERRWKKAEARLRKKQERQRKKEEARANRKADRSGAHRNLCEGEDCGQDTSAIPDPTEGDTTSPPPPCEGDNCEKPVPVLYAEPVLVEEPPPCEGDDCEKLEPVFYAEPILFEETSSPEPFLLCCCNCYEFPCECEC